MHIEIYSFVDVLSIPFQIDTVSERLKRNLTDKKRWEIGIQNWKVAGRDLFVPC